MFVSPDCLSTAKLALDNLFAVARCKGLTYLGDITITDLDHIEIVATAAGAPAAIAAASYPVDCPNGPEGPGWPRVAASGLEGPKPPSRA